MALLLFTIEAIFLIALFATVLALKRAGVVSSGAEVSTGATAIGLLVQLFSFGLLSAALLVVLRCADGRGLWSLLGDPARLWPDLRVAFLAGAALLLAVELLPPWLWGGMSLGKPPLLWLLLLPVSLSALLVQVSAEELLFRGYLQQQLAVRFPDPRVWLILPNVLFALAHYDGQGDVIGDVHYVLWAFAFGLAASDLTARTGSLGAAIGFHLANNVYASLFWGERDGADSGLALWLSPPHTGHAPQATAPLDPNFFVSLCLLGLMWLAIRIALRR
ncbi:CPBP family intramembrane glutamic endopeptidase [Poseidonocella sedimentorum]|uniref:CPBP family intramembrane glutamic endopeptidase n=1 Tax=Poseidonocella sedimentorum TaxID=871652 RepID=UPI0015A51D09|nr:CPBP family intramembrane glutamic endopeptidase [Poseidonocella sedimentorum]